MNTAKRFDADRTYRWIEAHARPRRVASWGELAVARAVARSLEGAGLTATSEWFPVGVGATRFGTLATFAAAMGLIVGASGVATRWPWGAMAGALLSCYLVNAPWWAIRSLAERWRSRVWTRNIVAVPPVGRDEAAPARVVFMAHYDSKSQRWPTGVRVGMVLTATVGSLTSALLLGIEAASPGRLAPGLAACVAVPVAASLAGLMLNASGNRSPGALDNASGLAVLIELARAWRPRPEAPADVAFVATGAEEVGLDGARAFLQRHEWRLRERPTLVINLESVGAGDRVLLCGARDVVTLAERVAASALIATGRLRVLGAGMDHQPFAARGLSAISLLGDVIGTSGALHSPRDDLSLIDRDALGRAAALAVGLADAWAERHQQEQSAPAVS